MIRTLLVALALLCLPAQAGVDPSNKFKLGDGTAGDKTIEFNKGLGTTNPKIKWNNSTSKFQASFDGTTFVDLATASGALYSRIVGSAGQVSLGLATDTSINSAIAAASAGDTIRILSGSYTENVSVNKQISFEGGGRGALVTGTWTFASGSSYSSLQGIKLTDDITINSGVIGIQVWGIFFASGQTFIDNSGAVNAHYLQAIQE